MGEFRLWHIFAGVIGAITLLYVAVLLIQSFRAPADSYVRDDLREHALNALWIGGLATWPGSVVLAYVSVRAFHWVTEEAAPAIQAFFQNAP